MLDKIIRFSIRNKIVIGVLTLLLVIWGGWSASKLPIDAVPDITNNQVQIITVCPTLAGQEVERLVTFPIEQSIANVPGLEDTRSISRFGLSVITASFKENVDIYFARQLISEQLKSAVEEIPKGIGTPGLAPVSTGLGEVYQYILHPKKGSESKYTSMELRTMQDWIVRRQLVGTPGVAEINSFGGELKQYEVAVNPDRLKAMDVSLTDIFNALETNNQNTGGAYIEKNPSAYFIRGIGLVDSLDDIRNIVVRSTPSSVPLLIKDIADVRLGSAIRYGAMTYDGKVDAVGGIIMMLKGANSNEVVKAVKEKVATIQKTLPEDVTIEPYLDRTNLVSKAISTVERNLTEGALIVIFVLVLFLGNLRAGLIVASAIPLSLLFALGMMNIFGVSANLMSMGAIDFGLIVDGAVIIVEATLHHLGLGKTKRVLTQGQMDEEVYNAASKIRDSSTFGEIIIMIVYIPILVLTGVEGKMFSPMAKTVTFAIMGAFLLSLTYIPMMSALCLNKTIQPKLTLSDRMVARLQRLYLPLLKGAIKAKYWVVGITLAIFGICVWMFGKMGGEFIPQLQEGDYAFNCILPQGTSLSQSMETSMQASRIIKQFDEVKMVVGKTGSAEVPTDPMPPEATDLIIMLRPVEEWKVKKTYQELAQEILKKLEVIPGVYFEANQPIQMRFNELMTGVRQDVAVKIFGEDLDSLIYYGDKVGDVVKEVQGASNPQVEKVGGLPQINVVYNRAQMASYGLSVETLNDVLSTAFAGKAAGQVFENERRFDLVVRLDSSYRKDIENVRNLMVPLPSGIEIPINQVADINYKVGPAQISRENGKRRIVVGFNVVGRDVQNVVKEIQAKLDQKVKLPVGYYYTYGGQFENLQAASKTLMVAVPIALLLILALLYFTFRSMKESLLIFTAIPMSAIGGVLALYLRGMPFSISAGVGFIALFGVAVLNGMVLIGTFNNLAKEGMNNIRERVIEGSVTRLRPVLMTATVASLGFLPMALSTRIGAEVQRPLATVVIGGLLSATFLTLFVLPLLYIIFQQKKIKMKSAPIAGLFIFLAVSFSASAQQTGPSVNIERAIELAVNNNKNLQASRLQVEAAAQLKKTAGELPKAGFTAQLGQYNSNRFDQSFQISQTIPFPTLFGARKELVNAQIEGSRNQSALTLLELKQQVRSYFYQIQYLQHNRMELAGMDSLYEAFINIAKVRFKAGDTKKVDISTAEAKKGQVVLLMAQNEVLIQAAYQNLYALTGSEDLFRVEDAPEYSPLQVSGLMDSSAIADHPSVKALYNEALLAEKSRKVEKAQGLPDFTLGYTNQSLIGMQTVDNQEQYMGSGNRFSYGNIGISIPLTFGATKARMRSLDLTRQAAVASAEQRKAELSAQLGNAWLQYRQDLQQYRYFKDQALPNATEILNATMVGYKAGDIGYVEYLYALQTATDIRLGYLKSIASVNQSVINIYSLLNQ
ncbi:MAG: CusA/CzcA family heavy metal efflux RND transporter [Pseudopedobacter saltans]|uniref:CusA/CzcA family heavy metal efflux RND transporter n=1 Tax=Pseudopedobacter saltans TaxID=151895 RepID=A0A2W5GZS6_9SPHI|nr:MAG: CusA/CzcA family heavy metal efflux RND transporter [Pseudopedobacter saltans]